MHEGGWEPFVHHFSSMLGGVVPKDEETRAGGISCTKSAPGGGKETRETWCKGNGGTRADGISCTKLAPATGEKTRGNWCKGNGDIRTRGISCTKPAPAMGKETRGTWCKGNGDIRAGGFSCTKSAPATPAPRPAPHHARRPAPRLLIRKFINFRMIIKVY